MKANNSRNKLKIKDFKILNYVYAMYAYID